MASTRIFVRGLPPSLSEDDFARHFAKRYAVTDTKLLPHRRIGYVGFKTSEEAAAAVKYHNKSFMRMSKIGVELADEIRPQTRSTHPTSRSHTNNQEEPPTSLKRKQQSHDNLESVRKTPRLDAATSAVNTESEVRTQEVWKIPTEAQESHPANRDTDNDISKHNPDQDRPKSTPDTNGDDAGVRPPLSDQDWIRSRTSRLLGLVEDDDDNDEEDNEGNENDHQEEEQASHLKKDSRLGDADGEPLTARPRYTQQPTPPLEKQKQEAGEDQGSGPNFTEDEKNIEDIRHSRRLFLRNLAYGMSGDDLRSLFEPYTSVEEVHLSTDARSGGGKGFAFVSFSDPEDAVKAYHDLDRTVFQGRLLHILPSSAKRNHKMDEYAISKLPLKKQNQINRKSEALNSTFNWNSLYMNADAVVSSISQRLGIQKSELFDPSSSDAAVKQAQAETHVIQETKTYFEANGIDLSAFANRQRGDTAILAKNFSFGTTSEDLRSLFGQHGDVSRVFMPPSGTIAIVEFHNEDHARSAFRALAYRKFKDSVLYLEKAPKDLLKTASAIERYGQSAQATEDTRISTSNLIYNNAEVPISTSTLFVRNLSFATTNERFLETFKPLEGLLSARIKTKPDPKHAGRILSMGFGFLEFRTTAQAKSAMAAMDGYTLDDHRLLIRASHKGHDVAEERRLADQESKKKAKGSKIIIKNLAFEVSKKDIRDLCKSYGQLRAVRLPKKFDNTRKGYAFAEFASPREAESAMAALRDTHLLGRKLVLEYASGEADDPEKEIEKMQQKVGKQSNSVALQKLQASSERRKFMIGEREGDGE